MNHHLLCFNSKMVRLRGQFASVLPHPSKFQFQNGAIASQFPEVVIINSYEFQFQNGAIARRQSMMKEQTGCLFQFQNGAIASTKQNEGRPY